MKTNDVLIVMISSQNKTNNFSSKAKARSNIFYVGLALKVNGYYLQMHQRV